MEGFELEVEDSAAIWMFQTNSSTASLKASGERNTIFRFTSRLTAS